MVVYDELLARTEVIFMRFLRRGRSCTDEKTRWEVLTLIVRTPFFVVRRWTLLSAFYQMCSQKLLFKAALAQAF